MVHTMISIEKPLTASVPKDERKAWARENLKGVEGTLRASFMPDFLTLDEDGIRHDVNESVKHGFCSVLVSAPGMSLEQKKQFLSIAAAESQGRINLCAVADDDDLDVSRQILAHAEAVGASHAMVRVPNTPGESEDVIFARYRELIDNTNLGVCLFATSNPKFMHLHPSGIPLNLLRRLAGLPHVVGIKLTQWLNPTHVLQCCEYLADRILINSADLSIVPLIAKSYPIQWTGQWNVQAVQSPEQRNAVNFMAAMNAGRVDEALAIYWKINPAFESFAALQRPFLQRGSHPWTHLKYYQWLVGMNGGLYPQVDTTEGAILDAAGRKKIRDSYASIGVAVHDRSDDEFIVGVANYNKGLRPSDFPAKPCYR
jgi:4-hydroxy-tetrahydrodipicolinate synthase